MAIAERYLLAERQRKIIIESFRFFAFRLSRAFASFTAERGLVACQMQKAKLAD